MLTTSFSAQFESWYSSWDKLGYLISRNVMVLVFHSLLRQADLINNLYLYILSLSKCFFCLFFPIKIVKLALPVTIVFQGATCLNMKVEEELQKCVEQNYGNLTYCLENMSGKLWVSFLLIRL